MAGESAIDIFNDALSLPPEERIAFLAGACGGDSRKLAEIASLLAVHDHSIDLPGPDLGFSEVDPGTRLGSFTIVREIGRGGMGVVYLAEDHRLRRRLAIKTLSPRLGATPQHLARMEREAQVLATLDHPNIGTLFGFDESDGICYLVLEYVQGLSLAEALRSGPIPVERTLHLCVQIANALASAHDRGVVHRDLKPANAMVTSDDRVKLVDFGLAKVLVDLRTAEWSAHEMGPADPWAPTTVPGSQAEDHANESDSTIEMVPGAPTDEPDAALSSNSIAFGVRGVIVGTPGYMCPEQLRGQPVDHRADIWSFGCMLYECLAGIPAFPGETISDRMFATLQAKPNWGKLPPDLPRELRDVLKRCLSDDPADRPASMHEIIPVLAGAASPESAHTTTGRVRRSSVGSSLSWLVTFAALIAIVVGIVVIRGSRVRGPRSPELKQASFEGSIDTFAISADGTHAAYASAQELVIRDLDEGTQTRRPLPNIASLDWSPSGNEILVAAYERPGAEDPRTVTVPAAGGEPRPIGPEGFWGVSWSPDGSRIAGFLRSGSSDRHLAVFDVGSGDVRPVPFDSGRLLLTPTIAWSPSGHDLSLQFDSPATTWIVGVDGANSVRLALDSRSVVWEKGGSLLCLSNESGLDGRLDRVRFDEKLRRIIGSPVRVCELQQASKLRLSRDGRRLLIQRVWSNRRLFRIDLQSGNAGQGWTAIAGGTMDRCFPRISPDGRRIAYIEGVGEAIRVVVRELSDGSRSFEGDITRSFGCPAWSPTGDEIAVQRAATATSGTREANEVWVERIDSRTTRSLGVASVTENLAWVRGRGILFQPPEGRNRDYRLVDPLTGSISTAIAAADSSTAFQIRPSPDGARVAVAGNRGGSRDVRTWIVDLADHSERLLWDYWCAPVGWSGDGRFVYVVGPLPDDLEGPDRAVFRVPVDGGTGELMAKIPGRLRYWAEIDVSPDGQTIVCSVIQGQEDLWISDILAKN